MAATLRELIIDYLNPHDDFVLATFLKSAAPTLESLKLRQQRPPVRGPIIVPEFRVTMSAFTSMHVLTTLAFTDAWGRVPERFFEQLERPQFLPALINLHFTGSALPILTPSEFLNLAGRAMGRRLQMCGIEGRKRWRNMEVVCLSIHDPVSVWGFAFSEEIMQPLRDFSKENSALIIRLGSLRESLLDRKS